MNSVAKNELKILTINDLVDLKIDAKILLKSALKVFHICFYSYIELSEELRQLYEEFFTEYSFVMRDVFDTNESTNDLMSEIERELYRERVELTIGIIRARNLDKNLTEKPFVEIWTNILTDQQKYSFELENTEEQYQALVVVDIDFFEFIELKLLDKLCEIAVTFNQKICKTFIPYRQIKAEGFTDWQYFNGLEALIRIKIKMKGQTALRPELIHITSIAHIIRYRLSRVKDMTTVKAKWHNTLAAKRNIEPLEKIILPESRLSFWSKPMTDESDLLRTRLTFGRKAQYHDLNVDLFTDHLNDNPYCVCTEWCNLGSFYYHNPVLRFFMTNHNQLYISNHSVVPIYYLLVVSNELSFLSTNDNKFKLLFQLMTSSYDYYQRRVQRSLKDNYYRFKYLTNGPNYQIVIGYIYNILRNKLYPKLLVMKSEQPLSETTNEIIKNYLSILKDLHIKIGEIQQFVDQKDVNKWNQEFEEISRKLYASNNSGNIGFNVNEKYTNVADGYPFKQNH